MPTPDVLASPAEGALDGGPRRRRPLILIAVAAVVTLVLGGGAFAGVRLWNGSGTQPEQATPSSAVAFVRLDLSPGYGQRLKINNLVKKFPEQSGKDASEELTQGIFDALGINEASYHRYVEPWFADRVGLALWVDDTQRPYGLVVLAVDDESAARTGLAGLRSKDGADEFGFAVRDGYAVVAKGDSGAQEAADAASQEAQRESLAESVQFRRDVDWLPARQTALAWADLTKAGEVLTSSMEAALGPASGGPDELALPRASQLLGGGLLAPGLSGKGGLGDLKGRLVIGARATDDGVEIRFRGFGIDTPAQQAAADVRSTVDSLPANSALAASVRVGDIGKAFDGLVPDSGATLPEDVLKDLPPAAAEQFRKEMEKSRKQYEAIHKAFASVSEAKISFAMSKLDTHAPALAAAVETTSAGKAADLAEAAKLLGDEVSVTTSGNKVEVKTEGYAADGGTLADQALYREALDGAPENTTSVVYIDLQRLLADADMNDQDRATAKPFKAVGIATGTEDADPVGLLRVVIR